jgi:hypothetical protein
LAERTSVGLNPYERETVISFTDAEPLASVYTSQRRVITKLKKNPAARLVEEQVFEGSPQAWFEIPKQFIAFRSKARSLGAEEGQRRAARLRASRQAAVSVGNADPDWGIQ